MGDLRALFAKVGAVIGQQLGEVSPIVHVAPNKARTETELIGAVFHDTTEQELQVGMGDVKFPRVGVIDLISKDLVILPESEFLIDGQTWHYRGPGGDDLMGQSVLIRLPQQSRSGGNKRR